VVLSLNIAIFLVILFYLLTLVEKYRREESALQIAKEVQEVCSINIMVNSEDVDMRDFETPYYTQRTISGDLVICFLGHDKWECRCE